MADLLKNISKKEVLNLKEEVAYQDGQIVSKTLAQNDAVSVTLFSFAKGEKISTHASGGDDTQLSVDDQLHALGQIVGDQGGQTDAQIHDVAIFQLFGAALGNKALDLRLFHYFLSPSTM